MLGMSEEATHGVNNTYMLSIRPITVWKLLYTWLVETQGVFHSEQSEKLFSWSVEREEPLYSAGEIHDLYLWNYVPFVNIAVVFLSN